MYTVLDKTNPKFDGVHSVVHSEVDIEQEINTILNELVDFVTSA